MNNWGTEYTISMGDDTTGNTRTEEDTRTEPDDESAQDDRKRIVDEISDLMEEIHFDDGTNDQEGRDHDEDGETE
ncbi:hypothetical protein [Haladaptatus sp.]|uniref:hypothetical protein n=1 Tax=Haladaptatus sp. TaxID=1973141 RepID=UPI003C4A590F